MHLRELLLGVVSLRSDRGVVEHQCSRERGLPTGRECLLDLLGSLDDDTGRWLHPHHADIRVLARQQILDLDVGLRNRLLEAIDVKAVEFFGPPVVHGIGLAHHGVEERIVLGVDRERVRQPDVPHARVAVHGGAVLLTVWHGKRRFAIERHPIGRPLDESGISVRGAPVRAGLGGTRAVPQAEGLVEHPHR